MGAGFLHQAAANGWSELVRLVTFHVVPQSSKQL